MLQYTNDSSSTKQTDIIGTTFTQVTLLCFHYFILIAENYEKYDEKMMFLFSSHFYALCTILIFLKLMLLIAISLKTKLNHGSFGYYFIRRKNILLSHTSMSTSILQYLCDFFNYFSRPTQFFCVQVLLNDDIIRQHMLKRNLIMCDFYLRGENIISNIEGLAIIKTHNYVQFILRIIGKAK